MRATLLDRTGDRATVRLTPSWLARLFGARETMCELNYHAGDADLDIKAGWYTAGTGRAVRDLWHGDEIRDALDFVPVDPPPRAIARSR